MQPDLAIALKLLEVRPDRYINNDPDCDVDAHCLHSDVLEIVDTLWPMEVASRMGVEDAPMCDTRPVESTPEKPGCLFGDCPRLVMVDDRGFFESFCERHLIEHLRDSIEERSRWAAHDLGYNPCCGGDSKACQVNGPCSIERERRG